MAAAASQLSRYRTLAREARAAALTCGSDADRDYHVMRAERFADAAWRIEEACDVGYQPSGLWG